VAAAFLVSAGQVQAQGRGNFDPEQMRQRMMDNIREQMAVKDDAEWKILSERVQKVMDARREVGFGGGRMPFGRRPGSEGDRGGRGGPDREVSPEVDALQKAIDAKAPADEIKAKLATYRESRKQKEAALETARQDLKKVLTVRQEAVAVMMGLVE